MKKTIINIIIATILGFILGIIFLKKFDEDINVLANSINNECYAIQIGVFNNYENAAKLNNKFNGIIVEDNKYYRVYINIIKDKELLNTLESYYINKNINYYLKPINISDNFKEVLSSYELLLKSSDSSEYDLIIQSILKEYKENELQNKGVAE